MAEFWLVSCRRIAAHGTADAWGAPYCCATAEKEALGIAGFSAATHAFTTLRALKRLGLSKKNPTEPEPAYGSGTVEKVGEKLGQPIREATDRKMAKDLGARLRSMLDETASILNAGEAVEAERRAKAVVALVRAERDVAEFLADERATAPEQDEEQLRAELRHRIGRYVAAAAAGAPLDVLERIGSGAASE
jgi:hypothetical protein